MRETIISDTSRLIVPNNIGGLDSLQKLYGNVTTTIEVAGEFGQLLPDWIKVKNVVNVHYQQIHELQVIKEKPALLHWQ